MDPQDKIPTKYWTLGSMSSSLIGQGLLSPADPVTLDRNNLKSINIRGTSEQSHTWHIEIAVFISKMKPDFKLAGKYRSWTALSELFCEAVALTGRRSRDLALPPDWPRHGIWLIQEAKAGPGHILVKHRFDSEKSFIFPLAACPPHDGDEKNLFIRYNFSDHDACIASRTHTQCIADVKLLPIADNLEPDPDTESIVGDCKLKRSGSALAREIGDAAAGNPVAIEIPSVKKLRKLAAPAPAAAVAQAAQHTPAKSSLLHEPPQLPVKSDALEQPRIVDH